MSPPRGVTVSVGGTPALEQDSIHSLFDKLPLMVILLITTTTILMFLAFGSLVLPIKAALMSALTLGSTMGILTWMFVDGHGSGLMNYTPQPLMAPMIGLIIAVIWGLSTDYEVFLVSRMVEARERGMSTAEAIRIGTATTGRLITGAALVLAVVAGAFVFSDLVMMKYLAFGLLIALLLDATVVRMFLVPAIMKMLGDDCWWAPRWMKRIQERLGLGETELPDERKRPTVREPSDDPRRSVGAGGAARRRAAGRRTTRPIRPPTARPRATHAASRPRRGPARRRLRAPRAFRRRAARPPPQSRRRPAARCRAADRPRAVGAVERGAPAHRRAPQRAERTRAAARRAARARRHASRGSALRGEPSRRRPAAGPCSRSGRRPARRQPAVRRRPDAQRSHRVSATPAAADDDDATTAIPTPRQPDADADGEDRHARRHDDEPKRRGGGGVSAQDLLRREGRL